MSLAVWTPEDIAAATAGDVVCGKGPAGFSGIGIDSRQMGENQIFVAISGSRHDGHDFLEQAVSAGTRCIVCQKDRLKNLPLSKWTALGVACIAVNDTIRALGDMAAYLRGLTNIALVAVTGSNGKTSTKELVAAVLARKYNVLATAGNFNNEIGMPLTLLKLKTEHEAVVLELGMNHPGEMHRLGEICKPDIGVITNIAAAHLEGLGSVEGVATAKAELLSHIRSGGTAVLNGDDAYGAWLASRTDKQVVFFGTSELAQVRASEIRTFKEGIGFNLMLPDAQVFVQMPVCWEFMIKNALAAAAVGWLLGIGPEQIAAGLAKFRPVSGRMAVYKTASGACIVDDTYNANPGSMENAIRSLASIDGCSRAILVAGDMLELGDDAARLHEETGRLAAGSGVSRIYLTGNFAARVAAGARAGGMNGGNIFVGTKNDIIRDLSRQLQAGDWVLVKGSRSTGMEEIVAGLTAGGSTHGPGLQPEAEG